MKVNPFQPGNPVPPGTFAGRSAELDQISRCILQTNHGRAQNILITGERGIGKTSMAFVVKALAEKKLTWGDTSAFDQLPPLITSFVTVQKNTASAVVVSEVIRELERALSLYRVRMKQLFSSVFDFFEEVNIAGTGFSAKNRETVTAGEIYKKASYSLRTIAERFSSSTEGTPRQSICIIIDEADQMAEFEGFASFWKVLQEKLGADNCRNIMLVLVGMPELKEHLSRDHESFLRTFTPLFLDRMKTKEGKEIILKSLAQGLPKKDISDEALDKIIFYSESYPHLIQEIGYSAFEVSQGNNVSIEDIECGLNGSEKYDGSIKRLGELFFSKMYDEVRKSENYKELLRLIAEHSGVEQKWVARQTLLQSFSKKKTSLDAYLQSLLNKQVIVRNPEQFGEYRLVSKMFQVYISKIFNHKV